MSVHVRVPEEETVDFRGWQLFLTEKERAEWETLARRAWELEQEIGKIRRRCNRRRKRFNAQRVKK